MINENISSNHSIISNNQIEIIIDKNNLIQNIQFLKDNLHCQFKQLTDIAGVDYPGREQRFDVVYHFLSFKYNLRIRVKLLIAENDSIESH